MKFIEQIENCIYFADDRGTIGFCLVGSDLHMHVKKLVESGAPEARIIKDYEIRQVIFGGGWIGYSYKA